MGPFKRRLIRRAYYDGVVDALTYETQDPGMSTFADQRIDRAKDQGWHDARAKRALRPYEFTVAEVLHRAEVRESAHSAPDEKRSDLR